MSRLTDSDQEMPLVSHLTELRTRLLRIVYPFPYRDIIVEEVALLSIDACNGSLDVLQHVLILIFNRHLRLYFCAVFGLHPPWATPPSRKATETPALA